MCRMSESSDHVGPELPDGGTVRPITRWGAEVMHRPQQRVTTYDDGLRSLVADMTATMYAAEGVGLAACQIGVDQSGLVLDSTAQDRALQRGAVCNPAIALPEGKERRLDSGDEGCLSFPGAFVECARPDYAEVHGQGLDGSPVRYAGTGLLARCLQHETDHCKGTVFGDRLNRRAYKKLHKQMESAAADYPLDWPAGSSASSDGSS